MKRVAIGPLFAAMAITLAVSMSGCQMVRKKFGITTTVSNAEEGTPDELIEKVGGREHAAQAAATRQSKLRRFLADRLEGLRPRAAMHTQLM